MFEKIKNLFKKKESMKKNEVMVAKDKNNVHEHKISPDPIPTPVPTPVPATTPAPAVKGKENAVHHHFLDKPTGLESLKIPRTKFKFMDIRKLFVMPKKDKKYSIYDKKKIPKRKLVDIFFDFLNRTGYEHNPRELIKRVAFFDMQLLAVISIIILIIALINKSSFGSVFSILLSLWTVVFAGVFLSSIAIVLAFLDIKLYNNTKQIEENLPDFLQLASANISAGMTVDRALWFAVRPKFGILAREIEDVAKSTLAGEELEKALLRLAGKYNSRILKESINLLVAGISSGGEIAELLNKISGNIKEMGLMQKEIAASVTTYVIFIASATIIAAPVLFALSTQLLVIIQKITSSIHIDNTSGMSGLFSFNFSGDSISVSTFRNFSLLVLSISSLFSACIISAIRKGNITDGLKLIPIFIAIAIVIYFAASGFFEAALGTVIK